MRLTIKQTGALLVAVPLIFELCFVAAFVTSLLSFEARLDDLKRSKHAILELCRWQVKSARATVALSRSSADSKQVNINEVLGLLRPARSVEKIDTETIPDLKDVMNGLEESRSSIYQTLERIGKEVEKTPVNERDHRFNVLMRSQRPLILQSAAGSTQLAKRLVEAESQLNVAEPQALAEIKSSIVVFCVGGIIMSILISSALALTFSRQIAVRLARIADNAQRIASAKGVTAPPTGTDETAILERAVFDAYESLSFARQKEVAILDNAAAVICSLDERFRFVDINSAALKLWRYQPEELLGMSVLSLCRRDNVDHTRTALESLRQNRDGFQTEFENLMRCQGNSFAQSLWSVRWIEERRTFFCVVHDVTEERAVERLRQRIISMASHDLKVPLTGLNINLGLVSSGKSGEIAEPVKKEIDRVQLSLERLMQLVRDLLDLDKIGVGKLNLQIDCISAATVCSAAKESLAALAESAQVKLVGPTGDEAILGDSQRLIQAVVNLLSNAIKYSPPHSVVTLFVRKADNQMVDLCISDQGPGIPDGARELIFESFYQLDQPTENIKAKSTGLGLAIVKAIAVAHEGECGVESTSDQGSTFFIRIPEYVDPLEADE